MASVVVGVTASTAYVTQRRVEAAYHEMFEQQFKSQVEFARQLQELRRESVRGRCAEFAANVRVRGLLRRISRSSSTGDRDDVREAAGKLYQTTEDELRTIPRIAPERVAERQTVLHCLFNDRGVAIDPPREGPSVLDDRSAREELQRQLQAIQHLPPRGDPAIGHLAYRGADGREDVLEALLVRITEPESEELLGTLVLGFSMSVTTRASSGGRVDARADDAADMALWLDGKIYGTALTAGDRTALAAAVTPAIAAAHQSDVARFFFPGDRTPYRVFFEPLNRNSVLPTAYQVSLHPLAAALAAQRDLRLRIFAFAGAGLFGALLLSALLAHGLSVPIRDLVRGTTQIRHGNFNIRLPVRSEDEIGVLTTSFNGMAEGLAEKERYRSVLSIVADRAIAEQLMAGEIQLGGENRKVSVLFCDIRGFTALTERMSPKAVIQMLNEHFTPLTAVVHRHHGVVDKFVGDLIMAVFGAPRSHGSDAWHAAQCALEMIAERRRLNASSCQQIQMGIGLATGVAVAGCVGSEDRFSYTVLGERVNLASRLCASAGRMEVIIDQTMREELMDRAVVEALPPLRLKGISETVRAYRLTDVCLSETLQR